MRQRDRKMAARPNMKPTPALTDIIKIQNRSDLKRMGIQMAFFGSLTLGIAWKNRVESPEETRSRNLSCAKKRFSGSPRVGMARHQII